MCGRYNIIDDPFVRELLKALKVKGRLETRYNIAPTEMVPVVRQCNHSRELCTMRWWLVPGWAEQPDTRYSMFNARAETLTESPAFRHPFKSQRCILPASSFIEWHPDDGGKQPYEISGCDGALAFAGLWDSWGEGEEAFDSCTLITSDAAPALRHIHNRQPAMLPADCFDRWLDPALEGRDLLPLLLPGLPGDLRVRPVDRAINNSHNKRPPQATGTSEILSEQ
ncbi:SOS response-associated peptidase [Marinobacterium arenosum]|uniref:SOS response-associated peptidase n=1 Tax=Marinobacterium arenosum TaxID=2862496 RepID=UPI001C98C8CA|nr:SOS response-associated peptidase [Marinobacterium arenosum]MBY4675114.1 SOS response-associated peptidase [Marinobacterium arenosum]